MYQYLLGKVSTEDEKFSLLERVLFCINIY